MDKCDKITSYLIDNVFYNDDMIFNQTEDNYFYLLEIIASLHNVYYEEVKGKSYNYMFHWINKVSGGSINDNLFEEINNEE